MYLVIDIVQFVNRSLEVEVQKCNPLKGMLQRHLFLYVLIANMVMSLY